MDKILVPVRVPQLGDDRRRHWAKLVTSVDSARSTGWAFIGEFVADGGIQDLPAGGVLLVYGERGGQSNPRPEASLYSIGFDATLTLEASASGRAWARTLRDRALELVHEPDSTLATTGPALDLSCIPDEKLVDELRARGWRVDR
ncbi:MAG TPA: hypothetical protein VLA54_07065 [Acidimicrobiia bacterium]|nr:hypothetical protein [Acidimicrobiia bacterium]